MERRDLLKGMAAGVAAGLVAPSVSQAASQRGAGAFYYTKENPGRWAKKAGGHLPRVSVSRNKVEVLTRHPMKSYNHYIIKHTLFDKDFKVIGEEYFKPGKGKGKPTSTFDLKGYKGTLHVVSLCNKHDAWVVTTRV